MSVARVLTIVERRLADQDHAILDLAAQLVTPAGLSPRREAELRQMAVAGYRRVAELTEAVAVAAAALEREERAADQHVQACSWCSVPYRVLRGACPGFRRIRRHIDRLHHLYRRHARRLEATG